MLTEQQIAHFRTFGFLIFRQLLDQDEVRTIRSEVRLGMETAYHHAPFDGTRRHWLPMMGPETPFMTRLLEDDRFCLAAEAMYGDDTFGVISDANRYVGNTGWHPDTGSIHQYGVKFAYYLEPVGPDSGALRLIPGSHRNPYHSALRQNMGKSGLGIPDVPGYVCQSEPGDVVAFDLRTWHASWGGSNDRWMCTLVYYNNPRTPEEEQATRAQAESNPKATAQFGRPDDPLFRLDWIANREGNPRRQRWIERMRELGFFSSVETTTD